MSVHSAHTAVCALLRSVAASEVMSRFQRLSKAEIIEKTPGELVTVADREAERRLAEGLARIEDIRIVGEEAVAAEPLRLDGLGSGRVWLIDPIDGTGNFAAGRAPFGMMIGLIEDGLIEAGWLYDPLTDRMCHAQRGHGAYVDGQRVRARGSGRARPIAALATWIMDAPERAAIEARAAATFELVPIPRCAAEHYPRNVLGHYDISLFKRTLPWDHAPGALFLNEAGGRVSHFDGSDYRVGGFRTGLLIAASPQLWDQAFSVLFAKS